MKVKEKFQLLDDELAELITKIANTLTSTEPNLTPDARLILKVNSHQVQLVYKAMVMLEKIDKELRQK